MRFGDGVIDHSPDLYLVDSELTDSGQQVVNRRVSGLDFSIEGRH